VDARGVAAGLGTAVTDDLARAVKLADGATPLFVAEATAVAVAVAMTEGPVAGPRSVPSDAGSSFKSDQESKYSSPLPGCHRPEVGSNWTVPIQ
jgi:hypothetical protein